MKVDKAFMWRLRESCQAALSSVAKDYGVCLTVTSGRFNMQMGTFKLNVTLPVDGSDVADTPERTAWKLDAVKFGFDPSDLDKEVVIGGVSYKITGWNGRRWKFPVSAERSDGVKFKFSYRLILHSLGHTLKQ